MLQLRPISFLSQRHPVCIAGPCSAESEEQVLATAHALRDIGLGVYRAGVWKPRTNPGGFCGVGKPALQWLAEVKRQTSMLVATEVATPQHVEQCLAAGVDILWIGARTTANPFAMQELAESLRGVDIPALVKNPINPDVDLWIGALQRLNNAGVEQLAAVHRGFSLYSKSYYRNNPHWHVAIELRRRVENLPILCDPSHIAGNRQLIPALCRQAMDLQYDGLMVECHINPLEALTDAVQQLTPSELGSILQALDKKTPLSIDLLTEDKIQQLRTEIDRIDHTIISALTERMKVAAAIGQYKTERDLPLLQMDRYGAMIERYMVMAEEMGADKDFIKHLYELIHEEALKQQFL